MGRFRRDFGKRWPVLYYGLNVVHTYPGAPIVHVAVGAAHG